MTNFKGKAIMCYKFFIENFDMIAQKQIFLVLHKSPVSHQYSGVQLTFIIELFVTWAGQNLYQVMRRASLSYNPNTVNFK